jgi:hypothetical protein
MTSNKAQVGGTKVLENTQISGTNVLQNIDFSSRDAPIFVGIDQVTSV